MAAEQDNPDLPVAFNVVDRVRPHTGDDHPISWFVAITTYFGYAVLVMFGQIRDFFGKFTGSSRYFGANLRPKKVGVHSRARVGSACVPLMTGLCFSLNPGLRPAAEGLGELLHSVRSAMRTRSAMCGAVG